MLLHIIVYPQFHRELLWVPDEAGGNDFRPDGATGILGLAPEKIEFENTVRLHHYVTRR